MQTHLSQVQPQPQIVYAKKVSHRGAILGIVFLLLVVGFFVLPIVNIESVNIAVANVSVTGSVSYALFQCGEVHLTGSTVGVSVDRYEWVCGSQAP